MISSRRSISLPHLMRRVYLDYNASTPVDPRVRESMLPYLGEEYGNASSLHWAGARARAVVEESRETVAHSLACDSREIIFTSGGTESDNLAIQGVVQRAYRERSRRPVHVITSQVEHQAVLQTLDGLEKLGLAESTRVGVDAYGDIDLDEIRKAVRPETVLISLMFVNNETGAIYPIEAVGRIARERNILFHTDAVQAVGKLPVNLGRLTVDLLSLSGHKIYGPKGVGALFVRKGVPISPLVHGGAQEMEKRGGTENLPGAVGLAEAMRRVHDDLEEEAGRLKGLRDLLQNQLLARVPGTRIHGNPDHRVSGTLQVTFEGVTSETILVALDREGIAVSSGSACASGAVEPSHVLMAMGLSPREAKGAVRFSLGRGTSVHDIEYALDKIRGVVERLRM